MPRSLGLMVQNDMLHFRIVLLLLAALVPVAVAFLAPANGPSVLRGRGAVQAHPLRKRLAKEVSLSHATRLAPHSLHSCYGVQRVEEKVALLSLSAVGGAAAAQEGDPGADEEEDGDPGGMDSVVVQRLVRRATSQPMVSVLRKPTPRLKLLRDLLFKKEAIGALTSAEFALKVDTSVLQTPNAKTAARRVSNVDYDRVLRRLANSYAAMERSSAGILVLSDAERSSLRERLIAMQLEVADRMRIQYAAEQAAALNQSGTVADARPPPLTWRDFFSRPIASIDRAGIELQERVEAAFNRTRDKAADAIAALQRSAAIEEEKLEPLLEAFVREDGSLDFDSVGVPSRQVARMGSELWARLNGVPPGEEQPGRNVSELKSILTEDAAVVQAERLVLGAQEQVAAVEEERQALYDRIREGKAAALVGTVALHNETFGSMGPLMQRVREVEEELLQAEQRLTLLELDLFMERACLYIMYEVEQTEEVQEQQKLVVAEFGLLDSQVMLMREMSLDSSERVEARLLGAVRGGGGQGLVDQDELSVVVMDVVDLQRRLGMDGVLENQPAFQLPSLSLQEVRQKIWDGTQFYLEGSKLLGTDVQYALKLFAKAIFGETLQPREVRTLRRTAKDLVTFVPFIVILLIPLSPVGHVLVFSFIQRFFPDFFPSPYTDRRQNLARMYASVEMNFPTAGASRADGRSTVSKTRALTSSRTVSRGELRRQQQQRTNKS